MNRILLPSLTGGTKHPRYFSFLAWMTHRFHKQEKIHNLKNFKQYLRLYESLLVVSTLFHHREHDDLRGIIGRRSFKKRNWGDITQVDLSNIRGASQTSSWEPANYQPATSALKLVGYSSGSNPSLVRGLGELVADGFEASLGTEIIASLDALDANGSTVVTREIIEAFSQRGCICGQGMCTQERSALANSIVLAKDVDSLRPGLSEQSGTFGLILDILSQSRIPADSSWCEEAIFRGVSFSNQELKPKECFLESFHGWRIQLLRSLQRYALECLWYSFHSHFKGTHFSPSTVAKFARQCAGKWVESLSKDERKCLKTIAGEVPKTLGDIFKRVQRTQARILNGEDKLKRFPFAPETVNELEVSELVSSAIDEGEWEAGVNLSVILLACVSVRMSLLVDGNHSIESEFVPLGGATHLGMKLINRKLAERLDYQYWEYLQSHFEEWVVGQHLKTASRKIRTQGTDTYRVRLEESGYTCFGGVRMPPSHTVYSNMFDSAISNLKELGLVRILPSESALGVEYLAETANTFELPDEIYEVTKLGIDYLNEISCNLKTQTSSAAKDP